MMIKASYAVVAAAVVLAQGTPAAAQVSGVPPGQGAGSHMHMKLQRTVLKVDVLTLDLCFDEVTGGRLAAVGQGKLSAAAADSITRLVLGGREAVGRVEFLRDIALEDFLDGVREDLLTASKSGLLPDSVYRAISAGLPVWYSPLERRGIRKGDVLHYEMQPEGIRSRFITREGRTVLDRTESSRARRNSPLAAWFAPGSQFRTPLLQSLVRDVSRRGGEASAVRARGCRA